MPFELENENEFDLVNVLWLDALLRHQIYLLRVAGSVRNTMQDILQKTEAKIRMLVAGSLTGTKLDVRVRQANAVTKQLRVIRNKAWDEVEEFIVSEMRDLTVTEVKFLREALKFSVPVELSPAAPPDAVLRALTNTKPFEGRLLKDWAKRIRQQDIDRIENQIKIGIYQGESSDTIAKRIVGTAALQGRDGVTQITRNNAQAIARTSVIAFSDAARLEFLMLNQDIFTEELFVATLDSRTTIICQSLDGKLFALGIGPRPPLHWQCRSVRVAMVGAAAIGSRPAKPTTQKMLLREYAAKNNIKTVSSRDALPSGHKGKFDKFARSRIRQMVGRVPAKVTYSDWLKRQSVEFQNDVLGKTRATLFRKGGLKLEKFIDARGKEIPLAQLANKEAQAFRAAGLDLTAF